MLTIYSKNGCPACVSAATLLDSYNVPYTTVKIDEDPVAKEFILSQCHRTVPQIYCGDSLFVEGGFPALMKLSKEEIVGRMAQYKFGSTN